VGERGPAWGLVSFLDTRVTIPGYSSRVVVEIDRGGALWRVTPDTSTGGRP
jgi:hypothetical protein